MTTSSPPQEVDSRSWFGSLPAAVLLVAMFFLIGLAVSVAWYSATPKVFESSATVLIEPRRPLPKPANSFRNDDFRYRHDQLMGEDNIITKALIKYDLKELPTLRDLPPTDQVQHIQENLEIQRSRENYNLYHLRFRSSNARDAQTVLATLVNTYERNLNEKYNYDKSDTSELLLKMKKRFAEELAAQIEKVEQLEKQIAAGQTGEDNQATLKELQRAVEKIQEKLDTAERMLKEEEGSRKTGHKGFNFTTLSPAPRGVSIWPLLPVFLLVGGGVGAFVGLMTAGLMVSVFSNRK